MDKQAATKLIQDTFNASFDEGRFRKFVINLLPAVNETKQFDYQSGNYIRHLFKDHIIKYKRLGTYTDSNDEKIDILVVQLKNEWALERSRTMLRNFTSDYLKKRDKKDAALVAYYTTNPDDWRFSYIRMEYKRVKTSSGKFRIKSDITPAKRFSFLVGKNEPNHTAQSQLVGILADDTNNPTITELETAFSVDTVTKQFYKDYRVQFEKLCDELKEIVVKDQKIAIEFENKSIDTANFAKKLMGQIVFLYFLQKKGWLGVGKDTNGNFKDWGSGPKNFLHRLFKKEFTDYGNFFNDVLEPLFYEALATERSNDVFSTFKCKIPFLNGGLFEPINDYNWKETDIRIDNDLIGDVFKTFDRYNFTVREDEPLEKEVAVDPEMLGKVFENLLPENLRKGKGAFYTPRTIVHYMCQESLINYLDTECKSVPKEDIETLIREGDIILELETAIVEQNKKYKPVLMDSIKENAPTLDDALANIKVCDPAIGSGAFPVGMLTEIVKARKVLEIYLDKKRSVYELKRHCIQNSLYGVDIDLGAIEIAKLRLWLSLVVDEDDYATIQPLPNLDYKIMQGNSLIEEFYGISLNIEKKKDEQFLLGSNVSELDKLIDNLHQKQDDFFNAEHPKEKNQKRQEVEEAIYDIFHNEIKNKGISFSEKAKEIENDLKEMTHGNKERNFFPWKLYFADVFREKGGFDVVIANPPYVFTRDVDFGVNFKNYVDKVYFQKIKNNEIKSKKKQSGKINLFALFILQGLFVQKKNSFQIFILPNNILRTTTYDIIRKFLLTNKSINLVADLGSNVFDKITASTILLGIKNSGNEKYTRVITEIEDLQNNTYIQRQIPQSQFLSNVSHTINIYLDNQGLELSNKILKVHNKLEYYCSDIIEGIVAHKHLIHLEPIKNSKPLVVGKTIKKYYLGNINKNILWDKKLIHRPRSDYVWEAEKKIVIQRISGGTKPLKAAIDKTKQLTFASVNNLLLKNQYTQHYEYILCLINSNLLNWFYSNNFSNKSELTVNISKTYLEKLPIPDIDANDNSKFINLVDQILTTKKVNPQADIIALETEIDQLVYELYGLTKEEISIIEESVGKA